MLRVRADFAAAEDSAEERRARVARDIAQPIAICPDGTIASRGESRIAAWSGVAANRRVLPTRHFTTLTRVCLARRRDVAALH
jgi:hypothetical protein